MKYYLEYTELRPLKYVGNLGICKATLNTWTNVAKENKYEVSIKKL